MLFMVYEDTGDCIKAYCVPDSFTSQSKLNVFSKGEQIATIEPNDFNEYMSGRHATGKVGFVIDGSMIPSLPTLADLELRECETDIVVYRRPDPDRYIEQTIFRLETQLFPLWRVDAALKGNFRFWYQRIERFSVETVRQILSFYCFGSLYSSGRILYQNYDYYLRDNHKKAVIMQDPYCEMAERLILLNRLSAESALQLLGERDILTFESTMEVAKAFSSFDEREIRRVFRSADSDVIAPLGNPVTRQLTASIPDETTVKSSLPRALDCLSEFDIIGLRSSVDDFVDTLRGTLGLTELRIAIPEENPEIHRVAQNLRAVPKIELLIEEDLELYQYIRSAYDASAASV